MKIYFDGIIYSWQKGGGVHRYFTELLSRLSSYAEIHLIMPQPTFEASIKGVKIISVWGFKFKINNLFFKRVRKFASIFNKILFNIFFFKNKDGIFCSTYYTTYKYISIPQVLVVHDLTHEKFPEFFNKAGSRRFINQKNKCIEKADAIICVSNATKLYLQDFYSVPSEKIHVVWHGVSDIFNLNSSSKEDDILKNRYNINKHFLLFVGERRLYKNFDFLLKAFAKWTKNNEFDLVVVGGDAVTYSEKSLINSLGISDKVNFLGRVTENELKTLYCLTDSFVFPSLDEGFGLPNLEAICCGASIIVSELPVFRETVGDLAVYFNPKDIESLISALNKISLKADKDYDKIVEDSMYIQNKFSWNSCTIKTYSVFQDVFNKYSNLYEKNR